MKKKILISLGSIVVASATLLGCSSSEVGTETEVVENEETVETTDFEIGSWNDNTFENQWLNLKVDLPEGWAKSSDEEMAELMGVGVEVVAEAEGKDVDAAKAIAELQISYGYVIGKETGANSQLVYENMAISGNEDLTIEEYAEALISGFENTEVRGVDYELLENNVIQYDGENVVETKFSLSDIAYQDFYLMKCDNYIVYFVNTYMEEDKPEIDAYMSSITPIY